MSKSVFTHQNELRDFFGFTRDTRGNWKSTQRTETAENEMGLDGAELVIMWAPTLYKADAQKNMMFQYAHVQSTRARRARYRVLAPASTPFDNLPFALDSSHMEMLSANPPFHLGLSDTTWLTMDVIDGEVNGLAVGDFEQASRLFFDASTSTLYSHMISYLQAQSDDELGKGKQFLQRHHKREFDELWKEFAKTRMALAERYEAPMRNILMAQTANILRDLPDADIQYTLTKAFSKRLLSQGTDFWALAEKHRQKDGSTSAWIKRSVNGSQPELIAKFDSQTQFWHLVDQEHDQDE